MLCCCPTVSMLTELQKLCYKFPILKTDIALVYVYITLVL
jgi:hypothetical protein